MATDNLNDSASIALRLQNAAAAAAISAGEVDPEWIDRLDVTDPLSIDTGREQLLTLADGSPNDFWTGFLYCSYLARVQTAVLTGRAFV